MWWIVVRTEWWAPFLCPTLPEVWKVVVTRSGGWVPFLWLFLRTIQTGIALVVEIGPLGWGNFVLVSLAAGVVTWHFLEVAHSPSKPMSLGMATPPGPGSPLSPACPLVLSSWFPETTYSEGAESLVVNSVVWACSERRIVHNIKRLGTLPHKLD